MDIGPPLGDLYVLASRVAERSVAGEAALAAARAVPQPRFDADTLARCAAICFEEVDADPDHVYWFCRLALELAATAWGESRDSLWWTTADLYVDLTRLSLAGRPRADRLVHAWKTVRTQLAALRANVARLERVGDRASAGRERLELADTLQAAGWLLAGPYYEMLDPDDPQDSLRQWLEPYGLSGVTHIDIGADRELPPEAAARVLRPDTAAAYAMPDPAEALRAAMEYLDEALDHVPGPLRGRYQLKRALVFDLLAHVEPGGAGRHRGLATAAAREAVGTEQDQVSMVHYLEVMAAAARRSAAFDRSRLDSLLPVPVSALRGLYPKQWALRILVALAQLVRADDLPEVWSEILALHADGGGRGAPPWFWTRLAHRTPENRLPCPPGPVPYDVLVPAVEAECVRLGVPPAVRAASLVHAALHVADDDLDRAVALLDNAAGYDEGFAAAYAAMIDHLLSAAGRRHARRLAAEGDHRQALLSYLTVVDPAMRCAARHHRPALATSLADGALTVLFAADSDGDLPMLVLLVLTIAGKVVSGLVGPHDERAAFVQGLGQHLMRYVITCAMADRDAGGNGYGGGLVPIVIGHHLLFKGHDFALLTRRPGPRRQAPYTGRLLREIAARERESGAHVPDRLGAVSDFTGFTGSTLELFFVGEGEIAPSRAATPTLEGLRRIADHAVTEGLLLDVVEAPDAPRAVAGPADGTDGLVAGGASALGRTLDDDTVVISLYLAERDTSGPGPLSTRTWLVAGCVTSRAHSATVLAVDMPGGHFTMTPPDHGGTFTAHWAALPVAELREEVNADPLGEPVTLRGEELLTRRYATLGGPTEDALREWRQQGHRHLVFWPHGPLHLVPFHLLHTGGRPLADDWIVTTVSGSAQLRPAQAPVAPAGQGHLLIAGSASGGVSFGLPEEPLITEHIRALRDRLPGARLLEGATPRALMAAAEGARYLHIAAHGSVDPEAPWQQCLHLAPGEDDDGRLFAHRILTLDLRGVDLVTLSACESALGRYDANDNHRGLPAAFLLAGAATVVGTLWPVTAPVATLFFERLYTHLDGGHAKRDAFHLARQATRRSFPEYRDWGAFVMTGHWR